MVSALSAFIPELGRNDEWKGVRCWPFHGLSMGTGLCSLKSQNALLHICTPRMIHGEWIKPISKSKLGGNIYSVQLIVLARLLIFCWVRSRDKRAAKRFLCKALKATCGQSPRVINLDKNAAYPPSIEQLKAEAILAQTCELRQNKYLNNLVEQDNRFTFEASQSWLGLSILLHSNQDNYWLWNYESN